MERQTADFTTHRIESGNHNGFWRIVNHNFNACGCFQSTDITSFATNDAAFNLVVVDMEHCHAVFNGGFRCNALDGLNHDALGFLVGRHFCVVHDFVDIRLGIGAGFILQRIHQTLLGFLCRQTAEFFQFLALFELHLLQLLFLGFQELGMSIELVLRVVEFNFAFSQVFLLLRKTHFALLEFVFNLKNLLVSLLHFLFKLSFLVQEFLLDLQQFLLFDDIGFFCCLIQHTFILAFEEIF